MIPYVHDTAGAVHLVAAVLSLVTGTAVLALPKGTRLHKKIGYLYAASMLVVCATSFMIYRLFGGFGVFHAAALVSLVTLAGGMIPALMRRPESWLSIHFSLMYWSVMGLYAAFFSEIVTRIPDTPFFGMLGLGTGMIMGGGDTSFTATSNDGPRRWNSRVERG